MPETWITGLELSALICGVCAVRAELPPPCAQGPSLGSGPGFLRGAVWTLKVLKHVETYYKHILRIINEFGVFNNQI